MITNALLVKYQGGYVEVTDDTSIGADGRFEGYLTVQVSSETDAIAAGTAMLAVTTTTQPAVSLGIEPSTGDEPYVDFGVGDTVTVPTPAGGTLTERVVSLTVTEDDEGDPSFVPEVNRLTVPVDQRVAAKVAGITAGSVGDPTPAGLASKQGGGALPSSFALPVSFGGLASPANSPSVWSQGETGAGSGGRVIVPVVSPPAGGAAAYVWLTFLGGDDYSTPPPEASVSAIHPVPWDATITRVTIAGATNDDGDTVIQLFAGDVAGGTQRVIDELTLGTSDQWVRHTVADFGVQPVLGTENLWIEVMFAPANHRGIAVLVEFSPS